MSDKWITDNFEKLKDSYPDQIVWPASHDAGMSQNHFLPGSYYATQSVVVTQSIDIKAQLEKGIRVFDIRPIWTKKWGIVCGHMDPVDPIRDFNIGGWHPYGDFPRQGAYGESLDNIIKTVNDFLSTGKTELIVLNLNGWGCFNGDENYRDFNESEWSDLFKSLKKLNYHLNLANGKMDPITKYQLKDLISPGNGAVAVIMHERKKYAIPIDMYRKPIFSPDDWFPQDRHLFLSRQMSNTLIVIGVIRDKIASLPYFKDQLAKFMASVQNGLDSLEKKAADKDYPIVWMAQETNQKNIANKVDPQNDDGIKIVKGVGPAKSWVKRPIVVIDGVQDDYLAQKAVGVSLKIAAGTI